MLVRRWWNSTQTQPGRRGGGAGRRGLCSLALCLPALLSLAPPAAAQEVSHTGDAADRDRPLRATVKIRDWDAGRLEGVVRVKRQYYLLQLGKDCRIRVDRAVPAGQWGVLDEVGARYGRNIWCFARRNMYSEDTFRAKGVLRPRLVLATGYAIEPLPPGRTTVHNVHGALGWLAGTVDDWAVPGTATLDGQLLDLSLLAREPVLVALPGDPGLLRRWKVCHLDGHVVSRTGSIRRGGRLVRERPGHTVPSRSRMEVPVLVATRVVFMHPAFRKVYPFLFAEPFHGAGGMIPGNLTSRR